MSQILIYQFKKISINICFVSMSIKSVIIKLWPNIFNQIKFYIPINIITQKIKLSPKNYTLK